MVIDLDDFASRIRAHENEWRALAVTVTVKPISPNHGKAIRTAEFEGAEWLASVTIRQTGELDLDAGRKVDGRLVAKHYDLGAMTELDAVLEELVALVRDGSVPVHAVTSWL